MLEVICYARANSDDSLYSEDSNSSDGDDVDMTSDDGNECDGGDEEIMTCL